MSARPASCASSASSAGIDRLTGGDGRAQPPDALEQTTEIAERVLEEAGVVAHVLRRGVDFVGDAGGELPDCLELLRLTQLTLEDFVLGDVGPEHQEAVAAVAVEQRRHGQRHEVVAAVEAGEAQILDPVGFTRRDDRLHPLGIGPPGALDERATDRGDRVEPERCLCGGVPAGDEPLPIDADQNRGDRRQETLGLGVRVPQLLFERLPIGDVGAVGEAAVRAGGLAATGTIDSRRSR